MRILAALALLALRAREAVQQESTTDAGVHRSSLVLKSGRLPDPDEVRVYDFVNYHRHEELPEPAGDARVALDARLLSPALGRGSARTLLQVGVRTRSPARVREAKPVNLCLVIDRSGSMADARKMDFLKRGLKVFLESLHEDDLLSIVAFSDKAEVLRAPASVADPGPLIALIDSLQPGGSTNLHDGLMLGYELVQRNLGLPKFPKVILLSDGQATAGVVRTEDIVAASRRRNEEGIALSTIGLGLAYNDILMSQLAEAGRGTYHFLDSAEGIERTFLVELNSLLGKVGRDPIVRLRLGRGVTLRKVYGYAFSNPEPDVISFKLLDLPLGLTQVIPIEIEVAPEATRVAEARLTFSDEATRKEASLEAIVDAVRTDSAVPPDPGVLKNATIARLASAFHDACGHSAGGRTAEAAAALRDAVAAAEADLGPIDQIKDKDVRRMADRLRDALAVIGGIK